ncbi:vacuolar ATPase assembly protein VMA22-like [Glandiceps talaboti]
MEDVCRRLDEIVLHYFDTLKKLMEERERLQILLSEGYYKLSKARYSMGNKAVSSLQYDTHNMKAMATITVSKPSQGSGCIFEIERKKASKVKKSQSSKRTESVYPVIDLHESTEVRRRKGDGTGGGMPVIQMQDLDLNDANDENTAPDPLRWFGVLVPPTLRQGQSSFIQAVEVACSLTNLQSELERNRIEYQSLLKEKKELMMKESTKSEISSSDHKDQ